MSPPPCATPHLQLVRRPQSGTHGTFMLRCSNCGLVMIEFGVPSRWRALRPGTRFCLTIIAISLASVVGIVLAVASGWTT